MGFCEVIPVQSPHPVRFCSEAAHPRGAGPVRWSTLGGDTRSFAEVARTPACDPMAGRGRFPFPRRGNGGGGRHEQGRGRGQGPWNNQHRWESKRWNDQDQVDTRGGRRDPWRNNQAPGRSIQRDQQFREQDEKETDHSKVYEHQREEESRQTDRTPVNVEQVEQAGKIIEDEIMNKGKQPIVCDRCGRQGHSPQSCSDPSTCERCGKEGHVTRTCSEKKTMGVYCPILWTGRPRSRLLLH